MAATKSVNFDPTVEHLQLLTRVTALAALANNDLIERSIRIQAVDKLMSYIIDGQRVPES